MSINIRNWWLITGLLCLLAVGCSRGPESSAGATAVTGEAVDTVTTVVVELPTPAPLLGEMATGIALTATAEAGTSRVTETPAMSATGLPSTSIPTFTHTPLPSATPTPSLTEEVVYGYSVSGNALTAYRIGSGPLKVVLVAGLAEVAAPWSKISSDMLTMLRSDYWAQPELVPADVTLWLIPDANPDGAIDGIAGGTKQNAQGVDLAANADDRWAGCASSARQAAGEAAGPYPFSEPEAAALRDFLYDASLVLFYQTGSEGVWGAVCSAWVPSTELAVAVAEAADIPFNSGYERGAWVDYLAGRGVPAVTVGVVPGDIDQLLAELNSVVEAVLAEARTILAAPATRAQAEFVWVDETNSQQYRYEGNQLIHPLAVTVLEDAAYVIDSGYLVTFNLLHPAAPQTLLAPGDLVNGVTVLELVDVTLVAGELIVLDRAGDTYRYQPATEQWVVDRYDRPIRDLSSHYYVGLTAAEDMRYLLETSYQLILRYQVGTAEQLNEAGNPAAQKVGQWPFQAEGAEIMAVDVAANNGGVYLLYQHLDDGRAGTLHQLRGGVSNPQFRSHIPLFRPRAVTATDTAVYLLDYDGYRLSQLDAVTGVLQRIYYFPERLPLGAVWASAAGDQLVVVGQDTIYIIGTPGAAVTVAVVAEVMPPFVHNFQALESWRGILKPITGSNLPTRALRLPGAPRHYRLGLHAGTDLYWHVGTEVRSVAAGTVIRADTEYELPSAADFNAWRGHVWEWGYSPPEAIDFYRGRQVWVQHENGVVSRYAHLSGVAQGIEGGTLVVAGQLLAFVGNSGSPASVDSETEDAHLHVELWWREQSLGQYIRPIEMWEWMQILWR